MGFLLAAVAYLSVGCANTTTTKVSREADGSVSISSGKNVRLKNLSATLPDGTTISVEAYEAQADPQVTAAQGKREKGVVDSTGKAVGKAAAAAVKGAMMP